MPFHKWLQCAFFTTLFLLLVLAGASAAHAGAVEDCPQSALRGCTAYIHSPPDQPVNLATAFLNRANTYARRTQYEKAFADYKRALELDPSNALIPYNVGNAYLDSGQPALAVEAFSRAVSLDAGFALAYFNRGIAHKRLGDSSGADADFRRTLELDPTAEHARKQLGQASHAVRSCDPANRRFLVRDWYACKRDGE